MASQPRRPRELRKESGQQVAGSQSKRVWTSIQVVGEFGSLQGYSKSWICTTRVINWIQVRVPAVADALSNNQMQSQILEIRTTFGKTILGDHVYCETDIRVRKVKRLSALNILLYVTIESKDCCLHDRFTTVDILLGKERKNSRPSLPMNFMFSGSE